MSTSYRFGLFGPIIQSVTKHNSLTGEPDLAKTETANLTQQESQWQALLETLKRCINHFSTQEELSWHPSHNKNYYLAKSRIKWEFYETQYDTINLYNFASGLAYEVAEERQQTVTKTHIEAQQNLMCRKMEYSHTRLKNQIKKLEDKKNKEMAEIKKLIPKFIKAAELVIKFIKQPATQEVVQQVFKAAINEINRQERARLNNPTLFKFKKGGPHNNKEHVLSTLNKTDKLDEMKRYKTIFTKAIKEIEEIANTLCPR